MNIYFVYKTIHVLIYDTSVYVSSDKNDDDLLEVLCVSFYTPYILLHKLHDEHTIHIPIHIYIYEYLYIYILMSLSFPFIRPWTPTETLSFDPFPVFILSLNGK